MVGDAQTLMRWPAPASPAKSDRCDEHRGSAGEFAIRLRVAASYLLGATMVALCAGGTYAQPYRVVGQCRGGVANGAYELRMPDGRLRIVGAFAHGKKTGTFIFWTSGGARIAVIPYEDDAKTGTVATWYVASSGDTERSRELEAPYVDDRLHGVKRSWHPNGTLRSELHYDRGALTGARAWTDADTPLSDEDARALAVGDGETEARFYAVLEAIVRDNLPRCELAGS